MSRSVIILPANCFVCGDDLDSGGKNVRDTTTTSEKQIYQYLEGFIGKKFERNLFSSYSTSASICSTCLEKLEKYDSICLQAARIQEEIALMFKKNQEKFRESKKALQCKNCCLEFSDDDEMNDHECVIDEDEIKYEVVEYGEDESSDCLEADVDTDTESKALPATSYTCNTCGSSFTKKREYQNHIKLAHLPEDATLYECPQCTDQIFVSEDELKLHNVTTHPVDPTLKSYQCPVCSKSFNTKPLINRHFGIHSSNHDRPFVCDVCGKSFYHYSSFQAHIKVHNDTREYSCAECPKMFRSQSHLNRHLKTHTKQKDHECPECGSKFAERYNLTAHVKTHYGISRKKRPMNADKIYVSTSDLVNKDGMQL